MPLKKDEETVLQVQEETFLPSTVQTIDAALTEYIKALKIFCTTNEGWKGVPVIWTSAERSFQIKNNKDLRDNNGMLIKPVVTIERTGMTKDLTRKGMAYANIPPVRDSKGGTITIAREINQEKTANFSNADSKRLYGNQTFRTRKPGKVVYETITIPLPIYIELAYDIVLYAEYQQQINEMITPFITKPGGINLVNIYKDGHKYEAFIQSEFSNNNNLSSLASEERKYQTNIQIKVLGYIIGDDKNQDQPKIIRRQNAVEVKIPREHVIVGDINEFIKKGFYRE
jgi:hypothetical protein